MASAYEQLMSQTSGEPVSYEQFHTAWMNNKTGSNFERVNPYDLGSRINNWFTGDSDASLQEYNNYLTRLQDAKTFEREDTAVQRAVKDIEAAGLNPWLALNGGSFSGTNSSASSGYQQEKTHKTRKDGTSVLTTALKILAIMAIKG